jgi:hypothetical protein
MGRVVSFLRNAKGLKDYNEPQLNSIVVSRENMDVNREEMDRAKDEG